MLDLRVVSGDEAILLGTLVDASRLALERENPTGERIYRDGVYGVSILDLQEPSGGFGRVHHYSVSGEKEAVSNFIRSLGERSQGIPISSS
jgi:hypothetical protein